MGQFQNARIQKVKNKNNFGERKNGEMEVILKELKLLSDGEIRAKCKELNIKGI